MGVLVLNQLNHFYFIMTAPVGFFGMHPAFVAIFFFTGKELGGCQPVHAVMKINDYPAANCQVTNKCYGSH